VAGDVFHSIARIRPVGSYPFGMVNRRTHPRPHTERPRSRRPVRAVAVALVAFAAVFVLAAAPAAAHADLDSSSPADGAAVEAPLGAITLVFTAPVEPAVDQFTIVDTAGAGIGIASVAPEGDEATVVVTPAEPLGEGGYALTWAIHADDGHVKTGVVTFGVTAAEVLPAAGGVSGGTAAESPGSLDQALPQVSTSSPTLGAERLATAARWVLYAALLLCVGGLFYLAWVHRGSAAEGRWLVFVVRRAALLVAAAAAVEMLSQVVIFDGGDSGALFSWSAWQDVLAANFGTGTALRLLGAALVLAFLRIDLDRTFVLEDGPDFDRLLRDDLEPLDAGAVSLQTRPSSTSPARLRVEASPVAFVGAALLVASEAFIGHTASSEPRALVVASDAGHLVAAGVWLAGCVMLAATLARRARLGQDLDARLLATRFSLVAGWALLGVAVTGVALAWGILDSVSALWGSTFGRVLLAKVAVVSVVAAIGAHNHRKVVPALSRGDELADGTFRRTVTAEALLLAVVLVLTAVLVGASTA